MEKLKQRFIELIVECEALKFGEFKLKSGRIAPWFFNLGSIYNGKNISKLGDLYAEAIKEKFGEDFDVVFGPAYKGIPLALSIVISLSKNYNINKGYSFDRKEAKEHGDKGVIVGHPINDGTRIILVDDVMTTGKTKDDVIALLNSIAKVKFVGLVIGVDRQEVDDEGKVAVEEFEKKYKIPVKPIITLKDIIDVLYNKKINGRVYIDDNIKQKLDEYVEKYGAK
jgi:orotate phosphoribosyltransferase